MATDPIASRYAQALFETVKADQEIDATQQQLATIGGLMEQEPALCHLLFNPGVPPGKKVSVLERGITTPWSKTVKSFIEMVIALGRAEFLLQIVETFNALVDVEQGRVRAIVRSAHPLSDQVLTRIRATLEATEKKIIL